MNVREATEVREFIFARVQANVGKALPDAKYTQMLAARFGRCIPDRDERVNCLRWLFDDHRIATTLDLSDAEKLALGDWLGEGYDLPDFDVRMEAARVNSAWKEQGDTADMFEGLEDG